MTFASRRQAFIDASAPPVERDPEDIGVAARALLSLAEALRQPAKIMADLDKSAQAHKAAAERAVAEQARAAKAMQELEVAQAAHRARIEKESREHDAHIATAAAEIAAMKKQAADALARAELDRKTAKDMRDEVERRYRTFAA